MILKCQEWHKWLPLLKKYNSNLKKIKSFIYTFSIMCMETEHVSLSEVRQRKVLYDTTSMWNLAKPNS